MRASPDDGLLRDGAHVSEEFARHILVCGDEWALLNGTGLVLFAVVLGFHVGNGVNVRATVSANNFWKMPARAIWVR